MVYGPENFENHVPLALWVDLNELVKEKSAIGQTDFSKVGHSILETMQGYKRFPLLFSFERGLLVLCFSLKLRKIDAIKR